MSSVILLFLGYYFGQVSKGKASIFGGKEPITKTGHCSDCGTAKLFLFPVIKAFITFPSTK